jgi:hypothetical protein
MLSVLSEDGERVLCVGVGDLTFSVWLALKGAFSSKLQGALLPWLVRNLPFILFHLLLYRSSQPSMPISM